MEIPEYPLCTLSYVQLFAVLWIIAPQAPLSMGLARQEYWSELPFPHLGDFLNSGIKPKCLGSPALAGGFFTTELPGEPSMCLVTPLIRFSHQSVNQFSRSHQSGTFFPISAATVLSPRVCSIH